MLRDQNAKAIAEHMISIFFFFSSLSPAVILPPKSCRMTDGACVPVLLRSTSLRAIKIHPDLTDGRTHLKNRDIVSTGDE